MKLIKRTLINVVTDDEFNVALNEEQLKLLNYIYNNGLADDGFYIKIIEDDNFETI